MILAWPDIPILNQQIPNQIEETMAPQILLEMKNSPLWFQDPFDPNKYQAQSKM